MFSPEDGLKLDLYDKHSGKSLVLGIDSAIDVVLLKIFDSFHKYPHAKLLEAYRIVKASFVCFLTPGQADVDFLVASIINARDGKQSAQDLLTQYSFNSTKLYFNFFNPL